MEHYYNPFPRPSAVEGYNVGSSNRLWRSFSRSAAPFESDSVYPDIGAASVVPSLQERSNSVSFGKQVNFSGLAFDNAMILEPQLIDTGFSDNVLHLALDVQHAMIAAQQQKRQVKAPTARAPAVVPTPIQGISPHDVQTGPSVVRSGSGNSAQSDATTLDPPHEDTPSPEELDSLYSLLMSEQQPNLLIEPHLHSRQALVASTPVSVHPLVGLPSQPLAAAFDYATLLDDYAYQASTAVAFEALKPESSRVSDNGSDKKNYEKQRRDNFKAHLELFAKTIPGMKRFSETRKSILVCTNDYIQQIQRREKKLRAELAVSEVKLKMVLAALDAMGTTIDADTLDQVLAEDPNQVLQKVDEIERKLARKASPMPGSGVGRVSPTIRPPVARHNRMVSAPGYLDY